MDHSFRTLINVAFSFSLGAFILYWIYRDFDFSQLRDTALEQMDWSWMAVSLIFGVLAHVLRGLRWRLTLAPEGYKPRRSVLIDSVFISYALSLIIPRLGEVSRSAVLKRYERVPFSYSLGTVVTERVLDGFIALLVALLAFLLDMPLFLDFFRQTGTRLPSLLGLLQTPWFYVVVLSLAAVIWLLVILMRRARFFEHLKETWTGFMRGVMSLLHCNHLWLFSLLTLLIWLCYFLHFSLTFYCFDFTSSLSLLPALTMFVGGTLAVIVPTPNGAGPWHFVIITLMMLYGVADAQASVFALLVHTIQTLLIAVLGLWSLMRLAFVKPVTDD